MKLRDTLEPLVGGDLLKWSGLVSARCEDFAEAFGPPVASESAELGYYPAERSVFGFDPSRAITVWFRDGHAVMVESPARPSADILPQLGVPCRELPQEIRIEDSYAPERIYCERGLALTVAQPLAGKAPQEIVRVRGIKPISDPKAFGPEFYKSLDDRISWSAQ